MADSNPQDNAMFSFFVENPEGKASLERRQVRYVEGSDEAQTVSWNWYDTMRDAHKQAFVVAKMAKADLLDEVHKSLQKAYAEGQTFEKWKKEIYPKLERRWIGQTVGELWDDLSPAEKAKRKEPSEKEREKEITPKRLETIFRTNMRVANAAGHFQQLKATADIYPFWRYVTRSDDRVRDEHRFLHNKVYRHDDPIWNVIFPPNGWNCRCHVSPMTERQVERKGLTIERGNFTADGTIDVGGFYVNIGKGWNYNPGEVSAQVAAMAKKKVDKYEPPLKRELLKDVEQEIEAEEKRENAGIYVDTLREIYNNPTFTSEESEKIKADIFKEYQTAPTYQVIRDDRPDCKQIYDVLQEACKSATENGGLVDCSKLRGYSKEQIEHCISLQAIEFSFAFGGKTGQELICGEVGDSEKVGIRRALANALIPPKDKQEYSRIIRKYAYINSQNDKEQYWLEMSKFIRAHMNPKMIYHVVHNHPNGTPLTSDDAELFSYLGLAEMKMVHGQHWCSLSAQDSLDIENRNQLLANCMKGERNIQARSDLFKNLSSQDKQTSRKAFLDACRIYKQALGKYAVMFTFSAGQEEVNDEQKD